MCPSGSAPNPENTACVPTGGSLNNTSPQGDLEFVLSQLGLSNINIGAATEVRSGCMLQFRVRDKQAYTSTVPELEPG